MIDLHTHSSYSDGTLSPSELIILAAGSGLQVIALTDHDTVDCLHQAADGADAAGITLIPGIELEIEYSSGEFHLLGLGITGWDGGFSNWVSRVKEHRKSRNLVILDKINRAGIQADYTEVEALAGDDVIGRPHFAGLLVKRGVVSTIGEGFEKYLRPGKPFYHAKKGLQLSEAAEMIHQAGGYAVCAHPKSLNINILDYEKIFRQWKSEGLDGIEVYHPSARPAYCRKLYKLCRKLQMIPTGGSDFHGVIRPGRQLGYYHEGRKIPQKLSLPFL